MRLGRDQSGLKLFPQGGIRLAYPVYGGIADAGTSEERVSMRVSQGGHDVPAEKLIERFPRTLANLGAALRELPCVLVFDNGDLKTPFRQVAAYSSGQAVQWNEPIPGWFKQLL